MDEQSIFLEALQKESPQARDAYLAEACAGDEALRVEVERLLEAHQKVGDFLQSAPAGVDPTFDQPLTERPGAQIGPYKLLQQIGEGGMGVVYMAEQKEPVQRRVALKIIKPGMDSRQVIARFEAERQALALMDHPHIAKVLDAGETDSDRPFFVMELVKGIPITRYCDQHHLPTAERLQLFKTVCRAVQHAHQKGVIHRDLKPSNILVAMYDDQPMIKVIDFGVAKATNQALTEKTMFTQFGQILGTLEYMSPEQASFNQLDVDTRSDIYSLGVLLYEMLTGSTPFEPDQLRSLALDEVMRVIREEEPPRPSLRLSTSATAAKVATDRSTDAMRLGQMMRGDLDWIVMKSLSKDRGRRYASAAEFAADIERHLRQEPVEAGPPSVFYRARKFTARHRAAVAVSLLLALMLASGLGVSSFLYTRSEQLRHTAAQAAWTAQNRGRHLASALERLKAEEATRVQAMENLKREQQRTREALDGERRQLYFNRIALAEAKYLAADLPRANQLLADCPPAYRGWEWHYLRRVCTPELTFEGGQDVCFSPDGRLVLAPSDKGRAARVWDAASGRKETEFKGHELQVPGERFDTRDIYACAFSPDGRKAASATSDGSAGQFPGDLRVWEVDSGKELFSCSGHDRGIYHVAFSPNGKWLASMSVAGWEIKLWDAETGEHVRTMNGGGYSLSFSPDSRRIASGSVVFDVDSGEKLLDLRDAKLQHVVFSPDGSRLAATRRDSSEVVLCDSTTGEERLVFQGHQQEANCVAWSRDGGKVASGSREFLKLGEVKIWDAESGQLLRDVRGATGSVSALAFNDDGSRLAVASKDVRVFDVSRDQTALLVDGFIRMDTADHSALTFSRDGMRVVAVGVTGWNEQEKHSEWAVKIWEATTGQLLSQIPLASSPEYVWEHANLDVSSDGSLVAVPHGNSITVYRTHDGSVRHSWQIATGRVECLAFGSAGRYLAARSASGTEEGLRSLEDQAYHVWDLETGQPVAPPDGWGFHPRLTRFWSIAVPDSPRQAPLWQTAFSPTSEWRAAWVDEDRIIVRNLFSSQQLPLYMPGPLVSVPMKLQGGSGGGTITRYDGIEASRLEEHFASREPLREFVLDEDTPQGLTFDQSGTRLAAASSRGVRVWDLQAGVEEAPPEGLEPFAGGSFGPNAERLVLKSPRNQLRVLPWPRKLGRDIARQEWYHGALFGFEKYFTPDGRYAVSEIWNGKVVIWDFVQDEAIELRGHRDPMCVAFSPGGQRLATGGRDGEVIVWDTQAWREAITLHGHTASVSDISFSEDGRQLATTSTDGTVRIWDGRPQ